ncbi:malonyl CoA-acyl carrier protein transacylase [Lysobacter sp. yr284]|uniref:ACP S-malonyltransferase n=1 Tax=Lysobacter sp. yr284 TaxID=1761791 RepID=UPI00089D433E|nr:ACP S-malonyltransferase [Lysobacter sp. yr284]SDY91487.1 malonyl CoA-acyl carrier protein transacylase [Lysobacter sp. yr284]
MTSVWVFPGQGSQHKGMGAAGFERYPHLVREADEVLDYSIRELCLEDALDGKGELLRQTQYTQPALFAVSALAFLERRDRGDALPAVYAGHSLGEFAALFAADAFDFRTGLALVAERGRLMAQAPRGAMAAVIGIDQARVAQLLADSEFDRIDLANINSAMQTVISGDFDQIQRCEALFADAGARFVRLNVSAAFHSRFMQDVQARFAEFAAGFELRPLRAQVIANVSARPYPAQDYRDLLARQITHPVKWYESMSWLLAQGPVELEEIGPGDVLTNLQFKIKQAPLALSEAPATAAAPAPAAAPRPGRPRTVFMYSGQGSQYYLMGQELYRHNAAFRAAMDACDALHRAHTGRSMVAELYDDSRKHHDMTDVRLSHPALFSLGYSLTQVLIDAGIEPDGVLGYSLGEYVAAVVAGAISLEDAMALVVRQAGLLDQQTRGGGMLTVLTSVDHFQRHPQLYTGAALASVNFGRNFVVSAAQDALQAIKQRLDEVDVASLLLPVDHAFHSAGVDPIEAEFRRHAQAVRSQAPRLPMYSAMRGREVEAFDAQYFWDVIRQPVDFHQLIGSLSQGEAIRFVDLGPTGTLSGFIKHGYGDRVAHAVSINQFGRNLETVQRLLGQLAA